MSAGSLISFAVGIRKIHIDMWEKMSPEFLLPEAWISCRLVVDVLIVLSSLPEGLLSAILRLILTFILLLCTCTFI